jgi:hypothetical protein
MIPESQLTTWANVGAEQAAQTTYASVKAALGSDRSRVRNHSYDIYLQGSYRNTTNIYGDSDVDVVVESNESYSYDLERLTGPQRAAVRATTTPATYTFQQFRDDVEASLVAYYGADLVKPRNKCIEVLKRPGRLDADVVPCHGFRQYVKDATVAVPGFYEGISFRTRREDRLVVNYPKRHYEAGIKRNQAARQRYKPTVRILKNLRNYLSAEGLIAGDVTPSYFVECLIFNAPLDSFKDSHSLTLLALLQWLQGLSTTGGLDKLVCGNEVVWLFGDSPEQWKVEEAKKFINAAISAWNSWGK